MASYNIIPLSVDASNHPILQIPVVKACLSAIRNTNGLRFPISYKNHKSNDILDWLQSKFGFQNDNVSNQREHLILALANAYSRKSTAQVLELEDGIAVSRRKPKGSFLTEVVTPIYHTIAMEAKNNRAGKQKHSKWRNYDNLNEYFWIVECFKIGWPIDVKADFFHVQISFTCLIFRLKRRKSPICYWPSHIYVIGPSLRAAKLAAIAAKLEDMESLNEDIADLKRQAETKQRCGDKYGPGHRCKTGTFKLLEADDVEEPTDTQEVNLDENPSEVAKINLHAIFSKSQPTAMKVHGTLNSNEVLILIDGGSTHNFISDVLVNELKLTSQMVALLGVQIRNGDVIRCSKVCRDLSLQLGGLKVVQDFYPFSIGGADLVLGIQWLATLNTVQVNWKEMFMIFTIDGKQYKLQDVSTGPHKSSSFQHLAIEPDTDLDIPDSLKPIITKYHAVFDEPSNLPPLRSPTHSIPLVLNSTAPNIRPYSSNMEQHMYHLEQVLKLLQDNQFLPSFQNVVLDSRRWCSLGTLSLQKGFK
uniref:Retrotransposon Gag domain, retroviral aspartyl protease n=1 Tax=Tanacetum cinerariifolium TaxID=118510 RepID=A0A6L2KT51_TANCI|nr:retrotransposon Gag domain, retroviral aspartyl protease [Tanacetum cinerariifolium]